MSNKKRHPVTGQKWADLPEIAQEISLFADPNGYRIRSVTARAIAYDNSAKVANGKYTGRVVRVQIIKAVRRG